MREHKYRAWDIDNGAWVYSNHQPGLAWFFDLIEKYNCELMQSTGLIDVNGKEIYENDIVRALGSLIVTSYIVKLGFYENKICACHRKYNSYGWYIESTFANNCYELGNYTHIPEMGLQILGNIYQHKELLNGTSES